ncbi:uncharacterized protein MONBRDRAFT_33774 [Monosiga brevicollis MX1]|uniref:Uncharacterized protein n=1 Tax=Monosiga brevicollis TaxID=81824 RepID=A9V7E5_MONBE|nr:uncharacterized protein MONBRDRAFT_33774 [Monosiga brevicollis MX1]EDQ86571.1 predicted protein [Monosiga brevicollis MX1]|eukprot:XP_001748684.1 hypothetical protein [Monosiga brevicollis MX1]
MTASVPGEDKWSNVENRDLGGPGLVSGHAYSLIGVYKSKRGHRLIQLRNPWGELEWTGDWSDNSPLWTSDMLDEVKPTRNAKDGLFWMSLEDFLQYFSAINICHVCSAAEGLPWRESRAKNILNLQDQQRPTVPSFTVRSATDCLGWISLHQDDERVLHGQPYVDLALIVLLYTPDGQLSFVEAASGSWTRQTQLRLQLQQATYHVVPFTTGRTHDKVAYPLPSANVFDASHLLSNKYLSIVWEVFRRYDLDMNGFLTPEDFARLAMRAKLVASEQEAYDVAETLDQRAGAGITRDGLVTFISRHNESEIHEALLNLGYSQDLQTTQERSVVLSVHSTANAPIVQNAYDQELEHKALELWIRARGKSKEYDNGKLLVWELGRGDSGTTIAVETHYTREAEVTIDCSGSNNVAFSNDNPCLVKHVEPGKMTIFHHLSPLDPTKSWRWTYQLNLRTAAMEPEAKQAKLLARPAQARMDKFLSWDRGWRARMPGLTQRWGGRCTSMNITISPNVKVTADDVVHGFGMVAATSLAEGDVLFEIPRSALITVNNSQINQQLSEMAAAWAEEEDEPEDGDGDPRQWTQLVCAMMVENTDPASRFRPYLDFLPDHTTLAHPMLWTSAERDQLLAGLRLAQDVENDLEMINSHFQELALPFLRRHAFPALAELSDEDLRRNFMAFAAVVMAYSFTDDTTGEVCMVPVADILNHVTGKCNAKLYYAKDALQIFNTYGSLDNQQLLQKHGFVEPTGTPFDESILPVEELVAALRPSFEGVLDDAAVERKLDLLLERGFASGPPAYCALGRIVLEDMQDHNRNFLRAISILVARPEQMDALEEAAYTAEGYGSDEEDDDEEEGEGEGTQASAASGHLGRDATCFTNYLKVQEDPVLRKLPLEALGAVLEMMQEKIDANQARLAALASNPSSKVLGVSQLLRDDSAVLTSWRQIALE